jgi:2,3-bisphosphoglycerate-independent phosphoglycerate mutase
MGCHDMQALLPELITANGSKIVFLVLDGLGGLPGEHGLTELETAQKPNLDRLAAGGICGLQTPIGPGITPGSGPGHLSLFGYDPLLFRVQRGALSALGVGFPLDKGDVAARGNFCTLDGQGRVADRRAGRIEDDEGARLVEKLQAVQLPGVECFVRHEKQYRFVLILRGPDLGAEITDTDPQEVGREPDEARACSAESEKSAALVNRFVDEARGLLNGENAGNMVLLRGFSGLPIIPSFQEIYGLRACALALYPMYRGLGRLLGMDIIQCGPDFQSQIDKLREVRGDYDFFFLHYKPTDSAGEDGDFFLKVRRIEELDEFLPQIVDLQPDVLVITGDHSTPSVMRRHSWHPVPVLLHAPTCRRDDVTAFEERACLQGALGYSRGVDLMPLALAHAGRLEKYGA